MLTELQKKAAQAIINIFETGVVLGDYASVVFHPGDPGGLTYGAKQTTLNSGNLHLLIKAYTEAEGALFADELRPYLGRLKDQDQRLNRDTQLQGILRRAGREDPVMIQEQDAFFDRVYWNSAVNSATANNIQTPLGTAVVFDSIVHGSWGLMRDRTTNRFGSPASIGEQSWIKHYVDVRRDWLANHSIPLLRVTVYRMDAFKRLIQASNSNLALPFTVRGLIIDEETMSPLGGRPGDTLRLLFLTRPLMTGEDVRQVQQALLNKGFSLGDDGADGIFGPATDAAVKAFQQRNSLRSDGIVGRATRSALGLDVD